MPPLAAAASLVWAAVAVGAAGDLDPSFDGDGSLVQNLGQVRRDGPANSIVRQSDGKYVIAGSKSALTAASPERDDFLVARYMPDGSLDPSFGGDGVVVTDFGGDERANDIELDAGGRIVVAGSGTTELLARYEADGDLDPTFGGGDGKVSTDLFAGAETTKALALDSLGRIVVVGSVGSPGNMTVSRYDTAGVPDGTFDVDGKRTVDFGGDDRAESVAIGAGDKVVVAGTSASLFALARLSAGGGLDTNADADPAIHFGTDGLVTTDVGTGTDAANDVAVQSDGKVVAVGKSGVNFGLARYNSADGSLDTNADADPAIDFGTDGTVTTPPVFGDETRAEALALDSNGKIVVVGTEESSTEDPPFDLSFAAARYNPNGSLDTNSDADPSTSFGLGAGHFIQPGGDELLGVRVTPDGKVIAAGQIRAGAVLAGYTASGSVDTSFGVFGRASDPLISEPSIDFASSGYVYPDGKVLVLGETSLGERGGFNFGLVRYNADGSLDSGFGEEGVATVSFNATGTESIGNVLVGDDGKIVVSGFADADGVGGAAGVGSFARLNADGSLDTSFDGDGKLFIAGDSRTGEGLLADGSLVAMTLNGGSQLIRKFTPAGIPDPSFGGGDGIAPFLPGAAASDVLGLAGSKFVVAFRQSASADVGLARYEADGDLDTTFGGGDGFVTTDFEPFRVNEVIAQPDGKLVMVAGTSDFGVLRYTADGAPDPSFGGGDGLVVDDFGASDRASDVALQADGKILVVGNSVNLSVPGSGDLALARYTAAGDPDPSFGGGDGKVLAGVVPGVTDFGVAVGVQPGGNIVAGGYSEALDPTGDQALFRFLPDPQPIDPGPGPGPGPGPDPGPGPGPGPEPTPTDPTIGVPSVCVEIRPGIRKRTKLVPGGGEVLLTVAQADDPTIPLKITAGARRGVKIKSVAFKVNKKAVTGTGSTAKVPVGALKIGKRNPISVVITLTNGKKVTVNEIITVLKCPLPPVTCQRLSGGTQLKCSSSMPLRARAVKVTVTGLPGQSASGSTKVKIKKGAKKGTYSLTMKPKNVLLPGKYVYKHVATTARKGEKLLAVRVLTLG